MILSIVVNWYEKDREYMLDLVKSLPRWAEWILIESKENGTDDTVTREGNVVRAYYNYTGKFDFSDAKNFGKKFASGDWILWLDADEHLDILQHDYIRDLLENMPEDIGGLFCTQYSWLKGLVDKNVGVRSAQAMLRLARNLPPFKFQFGIHEVIESSIVDAGYKLIDTNIRILHDGWAVSKEELANKLERNLIHIWERPELIEEAKDRYLRYLIDTAVTLKKLRE